MFRHGIRISRIPNPTSENTTQARKGKPAAVDAAGMQIAAGMVAPQSVVSICAMDVVISRDQNTEMPAAKMGAICFLSG